MTLAQDSLEREAFGDLRSPNLRFGCLEMLTQLTCEQELSAGTYTCPLFGST